MTLSPLPMMEQELTDGATTLRATVDACDDDLYTTLAIEPNEGELRQTVVRMNRDRGLELMTIAERAVHTMDRAGKELAA